MADAFCGPSNALQTFQKHTSADRTLQQDRTVSGRRVEQGFRSAGPANGALDAEFHAFQAPQGSSIPLQRAQLPLAHVARYPTPPLQTLPDWASDFQRLNVNGPKLAPSSFRQQTGHTMTDQGGWHTEFMTQRSPQPQLQMQQPMLNQWQGQHQGFEAHIGDTMYNPTMQHAQPEQVFHAGPQFDEAAFAQAFDQAKAEIEQASEDKGKAKDENGKAEEFNMNFACTDPGDVLGEYDFDAAQLGLVQETATPVTTSSKQASEQVTDRELHSTGSNQPLIGADTILAKAESEAVNPQNEADELSRTAGHLLDTLKDEKNSKFQQSSFLALMRQLRDKEVKVDGDKMVPVSRTSISTTDDNSHPGGRYYPYDAFSKPPLNSAPAIEENGPPIQHWYADP